MPDQMRPEHGGGRVSRVRAVESLRIQREMKPKLMGPASGGLFGSGLAGDGEQHAPFDALTPQQAMRQHHCRTVLSVLRATTAATQERIAGQTGLSQASVSRILADLRGAGLVEVDRVSDGDAAVHTRGPRAVRGVRGRTPLLIRLNPQGRLAVGIELEDNRCIAAVTDLKARLLRRVVTRPVYDTPETLIETVVDAFEQVAGSAGVQERERIGAVGVGTPGVVDTAAGILRLAPGLGGGLRDVPLRARLADRLGLPVAITNRSKAAAVGEHLHGVGRGSDHLVYVWMGFGVAAGLILGGVPHLGVSGSAGELGHVVVAPDGPPCACGGRGCLQAVAGGPAIAHRARELLRTGRPVNTGSTALAHVPLDLLDAQDVIAAAAAGDALARRVLDEVGGYLGRVLATVVNLLNVKTIILGGPVGEAAAPLIADAVQRELRALALSVPLADVRIVPGTLGENAGAVGAAALALQYAPLPLPAQPEHAARRPK